MKKILFLIVALSFFKYTNAQEIKAQQTGFKTIAYFSNKDVLGIEFNLIKLNDYNFIEVKVDEELDVKNESGDYSVGDELVLQLYNESVYLRLIVLKEIDNKNLRLYYIDEENKEKLLKRKIESIIFRGSIGREKINFKNIKEANFFIDNLK